MSRRTATAAAVAAGIVLLAGVIWVVVATQLRLTSVTTGVRLCAPANSDGQAMFGIELFRNNTSNPITAAVFEPSNADGVSVIGAYFQRQSKGSPGVLNDPKLVPHGFSFDPVAPGTRVTLVLGVQLNNPAVSCGQSSRCRCSTLSASRPPATGWCPTGRPATDADPLGGLVQGWVAPCPVLSGLSRLLAR